MKMILTAWAAAALSCLLVACGGGDSALGNPGVLLQNHPAASNTAPLNAVAAPRQATSARKPDSSGLFNWAESAYPQFFESTQANKTLDVWTYRYYPKTDIYLGVNTSGDVLGLVGEGGGAYNSVPLGKIEDFGCQVYPADCAVSQEPALEAAKAFLANQEALFANAVPTTGAGYMSHVDNCYLSGGRSKAYSVADFDSDPRLLAASQWKVGSTRSNVQVVAERSSTNPDGTRRREIDITYAITYADGIQTESNTETLISGSSSGSKMADGTTCTTPENKAGFRFFGDRRVVDAEVVAINDRTEWVALATGLPLSPAVLYSRYLGLVVNDPAGVATYATVSGPGIVSSTAPLTPMTLKLVSPRLLRDHPLFAGKVGNIVNLKNSDSFAICQSPEGYQAPAESVDCAANGASGTLWGVKNVPASHAAAADEAFDNLQILSGGAYTIKVYNDDGWKTVNGQAGKTPIAIYTSILRQLPFSLVSLTGASETADLFPRLTINSPTPALMASAINNKTAFVSDLTWNLPGAMPDERKVGLSCVNTFAFGKINAAQAGFYPISSMSDCIFPNSGAASASVNFAASPANMGLPLSGGIGLVYSNRNGNYVYSNYIFR